MLPFVAVAVMANVVPTFERVGSIRSVPFATNEARLYVRVRPFLPTNARRPSPTSVRVAGSGTAVPST